MSGLPAHIGDDDDALAAELIRCRVDQIRIMHGGGLDRHFVGAREKKRAHVFHAANAAADLHRHASMADTPDDVAVDRVAGLRSVEIDHMQAVGPLLHPLAGNRNGVIGEHRLAVVIALPQPHTAAAADVNRRVDAHSIASEHQESRWFAPPSPHPLGESSETVRITTSGANHPSGCESRHIGQALHRRCAVHIRWWRKSRG